MARFRSASNNPGSQSTLPGEDVPDAVFGRSGSFRHTGSSLQVGAVAGSGAASIRSPSPIPPGTPRDRPLTVPHRALRTCGWRAQRWGRARGTLTKLEAGARLCRF